MSENKIDFYNLPLVDYLLSIGEPLEQVGRNYYQHKDHNSLKINTKKNYFVWNSRRAEKNSHGGVVQYLQIMHNMSVREALTSIENHLSNNSLQSFEKPQKAYPKSFTYRVKEETVPLKAQKYLVAKRKIPNRIVRHFFSLNLISQNNNEEIVFKWYQGEKIVGFSKQGTKKLTPEEKDKYKTKRDYIKYVAPTAEKYRYWGFNYLVGEPKNLYFFESGIDLLSYYTLFEKELKEKDDFWLISIDGTAVEKVYHFLDYGIKHMNLKEVVSSLNACFDNDNAGSSAYEMLSKYTFNGIEFTKKFPQNNDWNNVLLNRKAEITK